jgi:hypothetical protein
MEIVTGSPIRDAQLSSANVIVRPGPRRRTP